MKTIELMSTEPRSVRAIERLDAAARVLWETDCGFVPVVDGGGSLVGVVTDRDLCMASYIQGRLLTEIPVAAVMAKELSTCRSEDPVAEVMQRMQRLQVHRLPVVDAQGKLVGVVSTNDLVRASHARPAAVDPASVIRTLAAIGSPRRSALAASNVASGTAAKAPVAASPTAMAQKKQAASSPGRNSGGKAAKTESKTAARPAGKSAGKPAGRAPDRTAKKGKKRG